MSEKQNRLPYKQLQAQLEAERQAREAERERADQAQRQLQQVSQAKLFSLIKMKLLGLFSFLKIKNSDIKNSFKILNSKLKIVLPSLCLLFVVGLVYFFAFAEPAEQLPQNQTFLNLAHQDINASTTAPITYTSTSTQDTQADFEQSGSGGFGYSATTTSGQVKPSGASPNLSDTTLYRNIFDLGIIGASTKLYSANVTKTLPANTDMKVFARSGSVANVDTDSLATSTYLDTSQADFTEGGVHLLMARLQQVEK